MQGFLLKHRANARCPMGSAANEQSEFVGSKLVSPARSVGRLNLLDCRHECACQSNYFFAAGFFAAVAGFFAGAFFAAGFLAAAGLALALITA